MLVSLVVVAISACDDAGDDPFLADMANWFGEHGFVVHIHGANAHQDALSALDGINPSPEYTRDYRILRQLIELRLQSFDHIEIFQAEEYQRAKSMGYDLDEMIVCGHFTESFDVNIQFYRTCNTDASLKDILAEIERHWQDDILEAYAGGKDPYGVWEHLAK
jgi:hypothetical protein